jgi:regulator of replication initiation timing
MEHHVRAAVRDTTTEDSKSLSQTLHQLTFQNKVLKYKNSGLREALAAKKKHNTANKALNCSVRRATMVVLLSGRCVR